MMKTHFVLENMYTVNYKNKDCILYYPSLTYNIFVHNFAAIKSSIRSKKLNEPPHNPLIQVCNKN